MANLLYKIYFWIIKPAKKSVLVMKEAENYRSLPGRGEEEL